MYVRIAAGSWCSGQGASKAIEICSSIPANRRLKNKGQDSPGQGVSVLECFVMKSLMLF